MLKLYYMAKHHCDTKEYGFVENELLTPSEIHALSVPLAFIEVNFRKVYVDPRDTYQFFGVRLADEDNIQLSLENKS